ncbi:ABC-2 type transport system ATP-binding protein [Fictibacillus solisalsi]|uniref:ABC-2 type transport system ATP-binding protein n=1 Tax=Fictibacillus solisalsi TaxID=459525 RepID=A0A1G9YT89_9BACL|nr:ABC transporter ATP-binding protein [Fictibacillus solisalsi]SDN12352.1 ABC-2 type transport system ATP-binding protein [Fictibacillus solisalsi]
METVHTLELKEVTKKMKGENVVNHLSFGVRKGEIFGLLGPNGAGKTTTIRMIVGLISMSGGEILVNGLDIRKNYEKAMEQIGAIVENPQMYDYLTGYKNLMQYARIMPGVTRERIDEVVKLVELEQAIHKKVKTYSLGMRQRLGVAQALLHRPSLLILDEPTNGLDPQGMHDLRNYLRLLADQGTSIVVSSHILAEMELMCDRVAVIQNGKLIRIDNVTNVTDQAQARVHFLLQGSLNDAKSLLAEHFPEKTAEVSDKELIVEANTTQEIGDINKRLVEAGFLVYGIQLKKKTLEERFLEMTGKGGDLNEVSVAGQ